MTMETYRGKTWDTSTGREWTEADSAAVRAHQEESQRYIRRCEKCGEFGYDIRTGRCYCETTGDNPGQEQAIRTAAERWGERLRERQTAGAAGADFLFGSRQPSEALLDYLFGNAPIETLGGPGPESKQCECVHPVYGRDGWHCRGRGCRVCQPKCVHGVCRGCFCGRCDG